jgi:hypothetical protein
MRTLYYVPVIHTSADLGSLAQDVAKRGAAGLGGNVWEEHRKTVDGFWDVISRYFGSIDVTGIKIYQDGMVAEGEVGEKIVGEGVKSGSKNYELVSGLLGRSAFLVKTEDFNLVKKERDRLVNITRAKSIAGKLIAFAKYRLIRNKLLDRRDEFIAGRIDETLRHGETGILFVGAYHNIKNKLPEDILVKEVKDIGKVREYHKLLPFHDKNKKRFNELSKYLISKS